jgi:hypothetical protein
MAMGQGAWFIFPMGSGQLSQNNRSQQRKNVDLNIVGRKHQV